MMSSSFAVSAGIQATSSHNTHYPQIADDYVRSFAILRKIPCASSSRLIVDSTILQGKYAKLGSGGPNPFLAGYLAYIDQKEKCFTAELARRKALQDKR
jgi:hypothetical protein